MHRLRPAPRASPRAPVPASQAGARSSAGDSGSAPVIELVLLAPMLGLLLVLLLHASLYLVTRQAVITAAAEGLKDATVMGADPETDGASRARQVLEDHSPATNVQTTVTVDDLAGTITITVTADAPAVAPGLPRTVTVTQTGVHERWLR